MGLNRPTRRRHVVQPPRSSDAAPQSPWRSLGCDPLALFAGAVSKLSRVADVPPAANADEGGRCDRWLVGARPSLRRPRHRIRRYAVNRQIHTVRLASGVRLAYTRHGDPSSVPVLLLHAWDESLGCFDRLFPLLPATMHVLAMDQRGHGDSDKPAGGYALIDVSADVEAFMDAMDL